MTSSAFFVMIALVAIAFDKWFVAAACLMGVIYVSR